MNTLPKSSCPRWCELDINGVHTRHVGMHGHLQVNIRQEPGAEPRVSILDPNVDDKWNLTGLTVEQLYAMNYLLQISGGLEANRIQAMLNVTWELIEDMDNPDDDAEYMSTWGLTPLRRPRWLYRKTWDLFARAGAARAVARS